MESQSHPRRIENVNDLLGKFNPNHVFRRKFFPEQEDTDVFSGKIYKIIKDYETESVDHITGDPFSATDTVIWRIGELKTPLTSVAPGEVSMLNLRRYSEILGEVAITIDLDSGQIYGEERRSYDHNLDPSASEWSPIDQSVAVRLADKILTNITEAE